MSWQTSFTLVCRIHVCQSPSPAATVHARTEDAPHMQEIVLDETMDDMDKNKDGFVTEQEYVGKPSSFSFSLSCYHGVHRGHLASI